MTGVVITAPARSSKTAANGAGDPAWVRRLLIALTLGFVLLFIILPAVNIFAQAFSRGWHGYVETLYRPRPAEPLPTFFQLEEKKAEDPDREDEIQAQFDALNTQYAAAGRASANWASIRLTLCIVAVVVPLNAIFGLAAAWAIARFRFKGRALLIALIELPFSVSPVVAGLLFVLVFGAHGVLVQISHGVGAAWLDPGTWHMPDLFSLYWRGFDAHWWPIGAHYDWEGFIATPLAIVLATTFVTFPFIARTLVPVMMTAGSEEEVAALSLGASGWQMFRRITIPNAKWGLFYGVILCTARAAGEFGAVSVLSAQVDSLQTMPLRIEALWNAGDNASAFTMATFLTLLAAVTLAAKAFIEWRIARNAEATAV